MDGWIAPLVKLFETFCNLCHHCSPFYNPFSREVIVQGSVRWPNGLALDLVLDRLSIGYSGLDGQKDITKKFRLYWVDAKLSTIGSSSLDGSEVCLLHSLVMVQ